jgi:hypothetical protein
VPRHGIGQQVQPSSAGSIPHDRVTIPQICSSRALPLHRPRQSTLRYPVVAAKWSPTHSIQRHPPLIHEPLPLRPTRWGGPTPITHLIRGSQIPIVNAAPPISPSRGYLPWRFAYASPTVRVAPPSWGRHPQTFTTREIHQHEGCVRFVPKKRQRGVSSPNLCICCVTSSVSVDHINPAGVKGIGEPGNVGTNAVICNAIIDATHVHGGACRVPAFLARTTGISAALPTPGLFSAAQ